MHPTVMAILADERHAELLRNAESWRRAAAHSRRARWLPAGFASVLARVRRPATASWQAPGDLCCA